MSFDPTLPVLCPVIDDTVVRVPYEKSFFLQSQSEKSRSILVLESDYLK